MLITAWKFCRQKGVMMERIKFKTFLFPIGKTWVSPNRRRKSANDGPAFICHTKELDLDSHRPHWQSCNVWNFRPHPISTHKLCSKELHGKGARLLWARPFFQLTHRMMDTVALSCNLGTQGAEAGGLLCLRPTWATFWVLGQSGLQNETLSQGIFKNQIGINLIIKFIFYQTKL